MSGYFASVTVPLKVGESEESQRKALSMFGGAEAVSAVLAPALGGARCGLLLDLCPANRYSHPVVGNIQASAMPCYLVELKVSKKRKKVVSGAVLGLVANQGVFDHAVADFMVAEDRADDGETRRANASAIDEAVPLRFSRAPHAVLPHDGYGFGDWSDARGGSLGVVQKLKHGERPPLQPTATARLLIPALDSRLTRHLNHIRDLFRRRAVWRRRALTEYLVEQVATRRGGDGALRPLSSNEVSSILPLVAFEVISGPWKRTWVRFGYDVRADARARFLQVFDVRRLKPSTDEKSARRGEKKAAATMQLCDLRNKAAQNVILSAARLARCDHVSGWFTSQFVEEAVKPLFDAEVLDANADGDGCLGWKEFLDVAAVADLTAAIIPCAAEASPTKRARNAPPEPLTPRNDEPDDEPDDEAEPFVLAGAAPPITIQGGDDAFAILGDSDSDSD
mmetsp:Transcript_4648/g.14726  ORF Transcript_4648/g.14726 Transcript_4648/m.14726 type:complete len:452 (-) Transcript_4648:729-2084(-)